MLVKALPMLGEVAPAMRGAHEHDANDAHPHGLPLFRSLVKDDSLLDNNTSKAVAYKDDIAVFFCALSAVVLEVNHEL